MAMRHEVFNVININILKIFNLKITLIVFLLITVSFIVLLCTKKYNVGYEKNLSDLLNKKNIITCRSLNILNKSTQSIVYFVECKQYTSRYLVVIGKFNCSFEIESIKDIFSGDRQHFILWNTAIPTKIFDDLNIAGWQKYEDDKFYFVDDNKNIVNSLSFEGQLENGWWIWLDVSSYDLGYVMILKQR